MSDPESIAYDAMLDAAHDARLDDVRRGRADRVNMDHNRHGHWRRLERFKKCRGRGCKREIAELAIAQIKLEGGSMLDEGFPVLLVLGEVQEIGREGATLHLRRLSKRELHRYYDEAGTDHPWGYPVQLNPKFRHPPSDRLTVRCLCDHATALELGPAFELALRIHAQEVAPGGNIPSTGRSRR